MIKAFSICLISFLFIVQAEARDEVAELKKDIAWRKKASDGITSKIKKSGIAESQLGFLITDDRNNRIFELNGQKHFVPASLTKMITAGASLENFPLNHQFVTQLFVTEEATAGRLKGDLYLKGGGDPGFVSENLWFLVNEFIRSGIEVIEGDIIVDDTRFDAERFDPSRDPGRVDSAYDAPIGAMSFNWNSVNVFVRAGKVGEPARVFADPVNTYIKIINKTRTTKGKGNSIRVDRVATPANLAAEFKGDVIEVSGHIGDQSRELIQYRNITQPDYWSGHQLTSFLKQRGVEVTGEVRTGVTPPSAQLVAKADGKPLDQVVRDMMKFSNNYVAEMLAKNLDYELNKRQGTMTGGMDIIRKYLDQLGIPRANYVVVNPSGLSRQNKFKPEDLHKVIEHLHQRFTVFPEFLGSMPIAGVDGTLKRRMVNSAAKGWVRAKTGTLSDVAGLAGYAGRPNGQILAFVFLYNGPSAKLGKAIDLFDDVAAQLVR